MKFIQELQKLKEDKEVKIPANLRPEFIKLSHEDQLHEMSNLYPNRTGLDQPLWFGTVGGQHGPRIKVSNTPGRFNLESNFVVSVSKTPKVLAGSVQLSQRDLNKVLGWIQLNHAVLMKLWTAHETGNGEQVDATINELTSWTQKESEDRGFTSPG